jgi:hypothetical protein
MEIGMALGETTPLLQATFVLRSLPHLPPVHAVLALESGSAVWSLVMTGIGLIFQDTL